MLSACHARLNVRRDGFLYWPLSLSPIYFGFDDRTSAKVKKSPAKRAFFFFFYKVVVISYYFSFAGILKCCGFIGKLMFSDGIAIFSVNKKCSIANFHK